MDPVLQQKADLRREFRVRLARLSPALRASESAKACAQLQQQTIWRQAQTILFYWPLPTEPDIRPLAGLAQSQGKQIILPRYAPDQQAYTACLIRDIAADLQTGQFSIQEPRQSCAEFPLNRLDLALVPGVGFGVNGYRLGRGRGFYDRLLQRVRGAKCGVAFDQQVALELPVAAHDIRLNFIVTPTRWLVFS